MHILYFEYLNIKYRLDQVMKTINCVTYNITTRCHIYYNVSDAFKVFITQYYGILIRATPVRVVEKCKEG